MLLEKGQVLNKPYSNATAPANLQVSPFSPGDRVNTLIGTGTIYQSGPYDSWIVLDTDWAVHYVRTEFVTSIPGTIEGAQPGYPTIAQLEKAGYQVKVLSFGWLLLDRVLLEKSKIDDPSVRIVKSGVGYNEQTLIRATREEPEPYKPVGLGGLI